MLIRDTPITKIPDSIEPMNSQATPVLPFAPSSPWATVHLNLSSPSSGRSAPAPRCCGFSWTTIRTLPALASSKSRCLRSAMQAGRMWRGIASGSPRTALRSPSDSRSTIRSSTIRRWFARRGASWQRDQPNRSPAARFTHGSTEFGSCGPSPSSSSLCATLGTSLAHASGWVGLESRRVGRGTGANR